MRLQKLGEDDGQEEGVSVQIKRASAARAAPRARQPAGRSDATMDWETTPGWSMGPEERVWLRDAANEAAARFGQATCIVNIGVALGRACIACARARRTRGWWPLTWTRHRWWVTRCGDGDRRQGETAGTGRAGCTSVRGRRSRRWAVAADLDACCRTLPTAVWWPFTIITASTTRGGRSRGRGCLYLDRRLGGDPGHWHAEGVQAARGFACKRRIGRLALGALFQSVL